MSEADELFDRMKRMVEQEQERWDAKLGDPQRRRAFELCEEGKALFWDEKKYDEGIARIAEAALLDPEYEPLVEHYRENKVRALRQGRVTLGPAAERILFPRLRALGLAPHAPATEWRWKRGIVLQWKGAEGREAMITMGSGKFGGRFEVGVFRTTEGRPEACDLRECGLDAAALEYLNQAEADAVLERVAVAFEGPILAWLEGRAHA